MHRVVSDGPTDGRRFDGLSPPFIRAWAAICRAKGSAWECLVSACHFVFPSPRRQTVLGGSALPVVRAVWQSVGDWLVLFFAVGQASSFIVVYCPSIWVCRHLNGVLSMGFCAQYYCPSLS